MVYICLYLFSPTSTHLKHPEQKTPVLHSCLFRLWTTSLPRCGRDTQVLSPPFRPLLEHPGATDSADFAFCAGTLQVQCRSSSAGAWQNLENWSDSGPQIHFFAFAKWHGSGMKQPSHVWPHCFKVSQPDKMPGTHWSRKDHHCPFSIARKRHDWWEGNLARKSRQRCPCCGLWMGRQKRIL